MPDLAVCRMLVDLLGEPLVSGSVTSGDEEPAIEDPEELERLYRGRIEVVIDVGPLWPEPSTILQARGSEFEITRVGKGPVPGG